MSKKTGLLQAFARAMNSSTTGVWGQRKNTNAR